MTTPDPRAAADELLELVLQARAVLGRVVHPDGISDREALFDLFGILDGAAFRAAMRKAGVTVEELVERR